MLSTPSTTFVSLALAGVALAGCGELPSNDSDPTARQSNLRPIGDPVTPPPRPTPPPVVAPPPPPAAPPPYTATVLQLLPGGINDNGVVGGVQVGNIVSFFNGVTTVYPLPADASTGLATGGALNNAGSIIGQFNNRAFVWIRPLPPGCTTTDCQLPTEIHSPTGDPINPVAINNANLVVGSFIVPPENPFLFGPQPHVFQWSPTDGFRDITPAGWLSAVATDVNDAGEVSGYGTIFIGAPPMPMRWSPVTGRLPLAVLSDDGKATAIANSGRVAGFDNGSPVIWSVPTIAGTVQSTPIAGPGATSIDDLASTGRVGGVAQLGTDHPFKPWTTYAGMLQFLPVPADNGNTISDVFSNLHINTCGSIVGSQQLSFKAGNATVFDSDGFLWTKTSCDPAPPAIYNLPPGTVVTASTTVSIQ